MKLITRKYTPKAIISIFYLRSTFSKNKNFQILFNHKVISIKVFKFIFSFSLTPKKKFFKFSQKNIMGLQNYNEQLQNNNYPIEVTYLQEIFNVQNVVICNFDKSFKRQRDLYHKLSLATKMPESLILGF